jgi:IS30 family transposase
VVALRERIGDWGADTLIGKSHHQAIVSLVERRSLLTRLKKVSRTDLLVKSAMLEALTPLAERVITIRPDNGREFTGHEAIAGESRREKTQRPASQEAWLQNAKIKYSSTHHLLHFAVESAMTIKLS